MGKIIDEYFKIVEDSKGVLPDEIYNLILSTENEPVNTLEPDIEDSKKYFISGYEKLSQAVFNFLHSGRGPYIMGYVSEFKINRLSYGFKNVDDLVHFSIWVIERYNKYKSTNINKWNELKEKHKDVSKQEILSRVFLNKELEDNLYEITYNMKNQSDFKKRLEIIALLEENETFAHEILSANQFYKQLDEIFSALNSIENVYEFNKIPKLLNQSELELRRVT